MTDAGADGPRLAGGIVAYRDGPRVAIAIRSLLDQELPPGAAWTHLWVVVAPDVRGTAESARRVALEDPRVQVVDEPERRGKSAALAEVFARAEGDVLVLLNGDAEAAPGAVAGLLAAARGAAPVFGVMGRPRVRPQEAGLLSDALRVLWRLHDELHREAGRRGEANHLSDELMLLPIAHLPPIRAGTINDGAFCGVWIREKGGELRYAPGAEVWISIPARLRDHLAQRRRILLGHRQVGRTTGRHPLTFGRFARAHPRRAVELVGRAVGRARRGRRSFALLATVELAALLLSGVDARRPVVQAAVWPRVMVRGDDGGETSPRPQPA